MLFFSPTQHCHQKRRWRNSTRLRANLAGQENVRNEARVLDIDLLDYDGEVIDEPSLTLPHPRLHQRAFVLMPLRDILPEWTHPKTGDDVTAMISALPAEQDIRAMAE